MRQRETGIGVTYQRMLWKGLFAAVEILPMFNKYLDENKKKIGNGFKLYTSYHVGYHISLKTDLVIAANEQFDKLWKLIVFLLQRECSEKNNRK